MDDGRKQWYDIKFWIVFTVGAIGMVCNQFYIMRRDFRIEILNPMISKYLIYSLGIMCITFLIGVLLIEHLNSNTFATLVMVCTVFLLIPNMFWHDLGNATDLSCNYAYKVLYEWIDGNRQEVESMYYRFFEINSVMMLMLRCVGIGVILLYVVRQTCSEITLWTISKIALITGCLSFSIMYVVKITDTTSWRLFEKNPLIDHLYMFQQDFIYSILVFIFIYFEKKSIEKKSKLTEIVNSKKRVGMYLTVICAIGVLVLLVAKDRLFDLGEYTGINVISLMWKNGEISRELFRDFMIICAITLFELIGIDIFIKLLKKRCDILQLILILGISFVIINRWTFYFSMYMMEWDLDRRLFKILGFVFDAISYFNPIQFMATLIISYIMQVKNSSKRKSKSREIGVVVCLNFLAYFCYLPTKAWFQQLLCKGMFNEFIIIFEASIRSFILITIILVLLLACILLVNKEKLSFDFNKVEVIIDTIFFTMTILCTGFYVKKEYCSYRTMDRRFYLGYIGSTFQYQCWSILMNLWFSLLVLIAVSISILFVTKVRNKIVKYMIVGFSLGIGVTSKIFISQFLKTALGRRLCAYLIDRPNVNGVFVKRNWSQNAFENGSTLSQKFMTILRSYSFYFSTFIPRFP